MSFVPRVGARTARAAGSVGSTLLDIEHGADTEPRGCRGRSHLSAVMGLADRGPRTDLTDLVGGASAP